MEGRNIQFWANRMTVVDCICNYGCAIRANLECVFLAVNIMDRVLTKDGPDALEPRILIIAILSLLIAAKYEDGARPLMDLMTVSEVMNSRGFHVDLDVIRQMEWKILKSINFKLAWPGPLMFLRRCSRADDENPEARMMGKYLLEIMLYDRRSLIYVPSHQAAAALYVSRLILSRADWVSGLFFKVLYDVKDNIVVTGSSLILTPFAKNRPICWWNTRDTKRASCDHSPCSCSSSSPRTSSNGPMCTQSTVSESAIAYLCLLPTGPRTFSCSSTNKVLRYHFLSVNFVNAT